MTPRLSVVLSTLGNHEGLRRVLDGYDAQDAPEGSFEVLARAVGEGQQELGRHVAELGAGEFFGEIALLHDEPRTASVRALKPAVCYTLNREDFGRLLETAPSSRASLDRLSLERVRETRAGLGARLR